MGVDVIEHMTCFDVLVFLTHSNLALAGVEWRPIYALVEIVEILFLQMTEFL